MFPPGGITSLNREHVSSPRRTSRAWSPAFRLSWPAVLIPTPTKVSPGPWARWAGPPPQNWEEEAGDLTGLGSQATSVSPAEWEPAGGSGVGNGTPTQLRAPKRYFKSRPAAVLGEKGSNSPCMPSFRIEDGGKGQAAPDLKQLRL